MNIQLPSPKSKQGRTQRGRGIGSGHGGHTAGRGTKGQKSRSGYTRPRPGFEGGQMPLSRRFPILKGFSRNALTATIERQILKLSEIAEQFAGKTVTLEVLADSGLIGKASKATQIKVLFDKDIDTKITLQGIAVSESVRAAIEKAGGSVE